MSPAPRARDNGWPRRGRQRQPTRDLRAGLRRGRRAVRMGMALLPCGASSRAVSSAASSRTGGDGWNNSGETYL